MKYVNLTDKEARITEIKFKDGLSEIELEWGGPEDRGVEDFDLKQLGHVDMADTHGNAGRRGWVILAGKCKLNVGDTIPLK